ncbi:hypothetical protein AQJ30_15450 [Streptomyces longwoodensis]|uniref:Uncharacterized protein n=1 Tax=Streptomyces longwoodensis TaxID=68231 RepID=A0A124HR80_9ACTN|nr:hypothetical protein [Streptomyces longwoodensis]KUN37678.1 hypothetical protein AQJ30_15450 [Streptomyces longwoodensis]
MMLIKVKPASALRTEFARWAVSQDARVNTCSHDQFCVPEDQFADVPEHLLAGALVDDQPYRPSDALGSPPDTASRDETPEAVQRADEAPVPDEGVEAEASGRARRTPARGARRKTTPGQGS